jgi:hypothetical protein
MAEEGYDAPINTPEEDTLRLFNKHKALTPPKPP